MSHFYKTVKINQNILFSLLFNWIQHFTSYNVINNFLAITITEVRFSQIYKHRRFTLKISPHRGKTKWHPHLISYSISMTYLQILEHSNTYSHLVDRCIEQHSDTDLTNIHQCQSVVGRKKRYYEQKDKCNYVGKTNTHEPMYTFPKKNINKKYIQSIPQLLNDFLLRQYALGDRVWAGITRYLITALDAVDAVRSAYDRSGIVAWTVDTFNPKLVVAIWPRKLKTLFLNKFYEVGYNSNQVFFLT